jgi:hypothetical protein
VDLKGNGRPDLIAVAQGDGAVIRLANDGNGGFGAAAGETIGYLAGITNAPSPLSSPLIADLNGDGKPDAAGGTLTVNLAAPAQAGDSIALTSSDPAVHVPASVALTAGAVQQSVSYSIASGFDTHHMLDITASLNGATAHAFGSYAAPNLTPSVQAMILHSILSQTGPVAVAAGGSVVHR